MTEIATERQASARSPTENYRGLRVQHRLGARPRRSRSTCWTRASTSTAARSAFTAGRQALLHRRGARRRRVAGGRRHRPDGARGRGQRDTPGDRPDRATRSSAGSWRKPKIGLYTNSAFIPTNPNYITGANVAGNSGHCALSGLPSAQSPSSYCEAMHALGVKLGLPASTLDHAGHVSRSPRPTSTGKLVSENFTALINPNGTIADDDGHPAGDHAARARPEGVHQRRRQLRRHQRQRRQRRAHDQRGDAGHVAVEQSPGPAHAGLDVRRARSTRPTRSPGASTSAAGSTVTPTATRCSTPATLGTGTSVVKYRQHAGREVRLRGQRDAAAGTAARRRRAALRLRPLGPVRVQPVLPLLEGAGRAARAQRRAVPEGRRRHGAPAPTPDVGRAGPAGGRDRAGRGPVAKGQSAAGAGRAAGDQGAGTDRDVRIKVKRARRRQAQGGRARRAKLSKSVKQQAALLDDQDHRHARGQGRAHVGRARPQGLGRRASRGLDRRKVTPDLRARLDASYRTPGASGSGGRAVLRTWVGRSRQGVRRRRDAMYQQVLDPVGDSLFLSALVAMMPLATLFVLLGGPEAARPTSPASPRWSWRSLVAILV